MYELNILVYESQYISVSTKHVIVLIRYISVSTQYISVLISIY
jgi:hypothetical protein